MQSILGRCSWVSLFLLLGGCSAVGHSISDSAAEINATRNVAAPTVAPGDSIRVTFPYKTEWDHVSRVRADGRASFNAVDDQDVAGLTLAQLDEKLTALYIKFKTENAEQLTVDIVNAAGDSVGDTVFVVGEVQGPGPVSLRGRTMTLFGAIGAVGGHLKATANLRNVLLVRRLESGLMRSWALDADIYSWGMQTPILLQPRDIVFVPNSAIDEVNIWIDQYIRQMIPLPTIVPAP
ncbi:MAG: protein involved in polysaccharide export with SLBB domain [Hyphomicrobiaceae bacterium]